MIIIKKSDFNRKNRFKLIFLKKDFSNGDAGFVWLWLQGGEGDHEEFWVARLALHQTGDGVSARGHRDRDDTAVRVESVPSRTCQQSHPKDQGRTLSGRCHGRCRGPFPKNWSIGGQVGSGRVNMGQCTVAFKNIATSLHKMANSKSKCLRNCVTIENTAMKVS